MAFRFVRGVGNSVEPATVLMYASGVVHPGGVVEYGVTAGSTTVSPAQTSSTTTSIIGVSLDYAQGASDTQVRVIPFVQGQLWEADCVNSISTASILLRHQLASDTVLRNIAGALGGTGESASTGVFLVYAITGSTSGSGKVLGTFLQRTPTRNDGFAIV